MSLTISGGKRVFYPAKIYSILITIKNSSSKLQRMFKKKHSSILSDNTCHDEAFWHISTFYDTSVYRRELMTSSLLSCNQPYFNKAIMFRLFHKRTVISCRGSMLLHLFLGNIDRNASLATPTDISGCFREPISE